MTHKDDDKPPYDEDLQKTANAPRGARPRPKPTSIADTVSELTRHLGLPLAPFEIPVLLSRPIDEKVVLEKLRALTGTRPPESPDSESDLAVLVEIPSNTKDR